MKRILVLLFLLAAVSLPAADRWLFRDGEAYWKVTCRTKDDIEDPTIKFACKELIVGLRKVSHAKTPKAANEDDIVTICVGCDKNLKPEEVSIYYDGKKLQIAAGTPQGVITAVYYYLQKEMGIRWLWAGEDGEFIRRKSEYQIPENFKLHNCPVIKYRGMHTCGDWFQIEEFRTWMAHNYVNVNRHGLNFKDELRFICMVSTHNIYLEGSYFSEHPEYFAEINGKHYTTQVCLNNDDVDNILYERFAEMLKKHPEIEILSVFPSDNQDYCQCAKCKEKGVSTSWFDFYNRLTDRLKAEFPRIKFGTIAYQGYISVPANKVRNSEFVEYASYPRCNIHRYGDPRCERNAKVLKAMQDWAATGVPMGDYGYEFDMFSGGVEPFLPFYSMIEDTVRTSVKLNHVLLMPEVGLSPKDGPAEDVGTCKNRLAEYIYAQMMWDPTLNAKDLIREWCDLAYGKAADVMYNYFIALDKQFDSMDIHFSILGRALHVAPKLVTPEILKMAEDTFKEADRLLAGEKNPAVEFEKKLFAQWVYFLKNADTLSIPKLEKAEDAAGSTKAIPMEEIDAKPGAAWTEKELILTGLVTPFTLELSAGFGGEKWFFQVGADGKQKAWVRSTVGVDDFKWKPAWTYKEGMAVIPFESFGMAPHSGENWQFRLTLDKVSWPEKQPATLQFCSTGDVGHTVIWWVGTYDKDARGLVGVQRSFDEMGWSLTLPEQGASLSALPEAEVYAFRNPFSQPNPIPEGDYEFLRQRVENGATVLFSSYSGLAMEKIFKDPTFKVKVAGTGSILLGQRQTRTLFEGEWLNSPHKVKRSFRKGYTPAYNLIPEKPEYWRILATLPLNGEEDSPERPYLMVRPYGKGTVIALSLDPWIPIPNVIANIHKHRAELVEGVPLPEPAAASADTGKKSGKDLKKTTATKKTDVKKSGKKDKADKKKNRKKK